MWNCEQLSKDTMAVKTLVEHRIVKHRGETLVSEYITNTPCIVNISIEKPTICVMRNGKKIISSGSYKQITFGQNECFLAPAGESLLVELPEASNYNPTNCLAIELGGALLNALTQNLNRAYETRGLGKHISTDWFASFLECKNPAIKKQVQNLFEIYDLPENPFKDRFVDIRHRELVLELIQSHEKKLLVKAPKKEIGAGLEAALAAMSSDLSRRLSTKQLAHISAKSEATLYRHFRTKFEMTPGRYAEHLRMKEAQHLLTKQNIGTTAYELGYSSTSNFSRAFKRIQKTTPREFQRLQKVNKKKPSAKPNRTHVIPWTRQR